MYIRSRFAGTTFAVGYRVATVTGADGVPAGIARTRETFGIAASAPPGTADGSKTAV